MTIGFVGLGTMGAPMAQRLVQAGLPVVVWNRTLGKSEALASAGTRVAPSIDALFATTSMVLLMLQDEIAVDAVVGRRTPAFAARVAGKTIVTLGTTPAEYSVRLESDVVRAGGHYVEAPVSGSRVQAERGALVGMAAGNSFSKDAVRAVIEPLCTRVFDCGAVPNGLRTKLAVNHYLITMVAALGETVQAARAAGVDLTVFKDVLDAGPMASDVSRVKLDKLVRGDFSAQAKIHDAGHIACLASEQARSASARAPLLDCCIELYQAAEAAGWHSLDMIAATRTLETR